MLDITLLPVKGGLNYREMGGYLTQSGKSIKKHKIIRCANLHGLTDEDTSYLYQYGVRHIVDFRSPQEQQEKPDRAVGDAINHFIPVFGEDKTKNSVSSDQLLKDMLKDADGDGYMLKLYKDFIVNEQAVNAYRRFFEILLSNTGTNEAVMFHCTAGKDRTGLGAVYFLMAIGADRETILEDYMASNDYLAGFNEQMAGHFDSQGIPAQIQKEMMALFTVKPDYLMSAFEEMENQAGSPSKYLETYLGIDEKKAACLKEIYLEQ